MCLLPSAWKQKPAVLLSVPESHRLVSDSVPVVVDNLFGPALGWRRSPTASNGRAKLDDVKEVREPQPCFLKVFGQSPFEDGLGRPRQRGGPVFPPYKL